MDKALEIACYLILNNTHVNVEKNGEVINKLTSEEKTQVMMCLLGSLAKMQLITGITREELYSNMKTLYPELNLAKFERDEHE